MYFKAADIFLNPVQSGGGIKTKMVEAIGFGTTVIATAAGAKGIDKAVCGDKLIIVADSNWKEFADAVISIPDTTIRTQADFYDIYFWGNIIQNTSLIQKMR
jgi:glycosyltransferase involved in cell wall biosynthesis